ncbi:MAG: helix-turn-helix domain-containing protein [Cyanobacteria bacterium P01_F01_bin.86]
MSQSRDLSSREEALLRLYSNCRLSMDVFEFYRKWNVTQQQIAAICGCSVATVERWFGSQRQPPDPIYTRRLAEMDLIWELWDELPESFKQRLCPPQASESHH